jgi:transposase
MENVYARCCGLDVHRDTVTACRRLRQPDGRVEEEVRTYDTTTRALQRLAGWLREGGVTHVAMESTGVYWKPIWNILEPEFKVLLVNARHIKQVPGRKTDVKDCQWIAQLLQHGLLRGSFVPEERIRDLRDLTRHRVKLVEQQTAVVNRIHKTLQDANIKLGSVASDILGVSGRAMLEAVIAGETDSTVLAERAQRRLRGKIPALREALCGRVREHHRFLLKTLLAHLDFLERQIQDLDERIEEVTRPFQGLIERMTTVPGLGRRASEAVLAEIGPDMSQFPSDAHLTSWAGICPGSHETAGKRKSGRTAKGNHWLKKTLCQAAWSAARTKDTYLAAQFRRIAPRRGKKRAIIAVSNSILRAVYHILSAEGIVYRDLGGDYFDRLDPRRLTRYFVRRLESLGHKVTLEPKENAA